MPNENISENPLYFSYFVVHKNSSFTHTKELHSQLRFGVNGADSLSGCHSLRFWLHATNRDWENYTFFQTNSHFNTCRLIASGVLDVGAIDIFCMLRLKKQLPHVFQNLKILQNQILGPFPSQPICLNQNHEYLKNNLIQNLTTMHENIDTQILLKNAYVKKFVQVSDHDYQTLEEQFISARHVQPNIMDANVLISKL